MDAGRANIPDVVVSNLRDFYKGLVVKAAEAVQRHGRESNEYALALALITAAVTTTQHCYGFGTPQEARAFLQKL